MSIYGSIAIVGGSIVAASLFTAAYITFFTDDKVRDRVEFLLLWLVPIGVFAIYIRREWKRLKWRIDG